MELLRINEFLVELVTATLMFVVLRLCYQIFMNKMITEI